MSFRNWAKRAVDACGIPRYWINATLFELRMVKVRLASFLPSHKRSVHALQMREPLQLIFGCGETRYPNWVGIDSFSGATVDLLLDLRRRLPFRDESVLYCYSEHFFEHLYPEEGVAHLQEVLRVLKPHGVYRLAIPAGIRFIERYLAGDDAFFKLAFPWSERPMEAVHAILYFSGSHRNLLDFNEMRYLGLHVGFQEVILSEVNSSSRPELNIDRDEPQRVAETFYVEMVKGP